MNNSIEMKKGKYTAFVTPDDVEYHKSKGFKVVGEKIKRASPIKKEEAAKEDKE